MNTKPYSSFKIVLSLITIVLLLGTVSVSGSVITPVEIILEGKLEHGSITDGVIVITSGIVKIGDATFRISTIPPRGFNESLNYVKVETGKLYSGVIGLERGHLMGLSATYTSINENTLSLVFGYGEAYYPSSTFISVYGRPGIFINATGILILSEDRVTISAKGNAFLPVGEREVLQEGCFIAVAKKPQILGETLSFSRWEMWWIGIIEDNDYYYVAVPKGEVTPFFIYVSPTSRLAGLMSIFGALSSERGVGIRVNVSCSTGNTSLAYLLTRSLRRSLEEFASQEQAFLTKTGFDAEKYLKEVKYAGVLLAESEHAFENGDFEVGVGLLEKALVKANIALEALSQAKTDCVGMFLFLIAFTFFLSSLVGAMIEKKKAFVSIALFTALVLVEIALIPQARMAIFLLNPEALSRLTSTSLALSLFVATVTLLIVVMLILEAKGTLLSDLFWYSVKSIRKRMLRAALTIVTIAVVSAVSGSLLAVGTIVSVREETYPSVFRGLSVSSHVTTVTYIFRGLDQANEFIVNEFFEPIPEFQVKWLSGIEGVGKTYIVAISPVFVSKSGERTSAFLVATDAPLFNGTSLKRTMVSASLAEKLRIRAGDTIMIIGKDVVISTADSVLEEPVKLVDGVPLDEVEGPFVLTSLEYVSQPLTVYRVILEGNFSNDLAKRLVEISYEKNSTFTVLGGAQITQRTFRSFRTCLGTGSETKSLLISGEFEKFVGAPELLVLMGLSSLMIVIALLGSLYERQREYSTISALGASPGRVSLLMFVEGLSYGLIGGVLGYVLSQFLQAYVSNPVSPIQQYTFSSMLASFIIAIASSIVGSLIPARKVILKVVPSRFLFKKIEEVKLFEDHAEATIPLRIIGSVDDFLTYVSSFTKRPPPMSWGPIYMQVSPRKEKDGGNMVEMVLSYRGERVASYRIQLLLPENPGSTIKAVAYAVTGEWGIDHKHCAREMLTALREDLLQYVEWKKQLSKKTAQDSPG
ncbi:MAG: FtsX-like permease family protein [Thermoproteota archaeon]|nr:FtsX-like permease family protein [Candidatus Brockarchaeota archaeon]